MGFQRYPIKKSKSGITAILLYTGDNIGSAGPRFQIQYKNYTISDDIPLTSQNVNEFIEDNPDLEDINKILVQEGERVKKIEVSIATVGLFATSYTQHKESTKKNEQEKAIIQNQVATLNTQDCIKMPDSINTIIIYTRVPKEHYNNVLENGLKNYEQIHQETRFTIQTLAGHDQCVYFRPDFWISENALRDEPIIGIKVDSKKVKIANQEIRTLDRREHDIDNMYLNSAITYDQFLVGQKKAQQETPRKFPYSNKEGFLVWLTYQGSESSNYIAYIPEIAINISSPIEKEMFAHINMQHKTSFQKR